MNINLISGENVNISINDLEEMFVEYLTNKPCEASCFDYVEIHFFTYFVKGYPYMNDMYELVNKLKNIYYNGKTL